MFGGALSTTLLGTEGTEEQTPRTALQQLTLGRVGLKGSQVSKHSAAQHTGRGGAAHLLPESCILVNIPGVAVGPFQVKALPVVVLYRSNSKNDASVTCR